MGERRAWINAMAHIDWPVTGKSFGNCNCDHGCPCQFDGLPTWFNRLRHRGGGIH